jgi:protein-L-isoaspartate(D-aspartate) O-methyltransferase
MEVLRTPKIIEALITVDRSFFVPTKFLAEAYNDYPLPIGEGQTISQPTTVAIMLELLEAREGDFVLEIGGGSGWVTALLARIVGPYGYVFSYELSKNVYNFGKRNLNHFILSNYSFDLGDVRKNWSQNAPYNRIISGAAMEQEDLDELSGLLAEGGIIVAPLKDRDIVKIVKDNHGNTTQRKYSGFVFVPLQ